MTKKQAEALFASLNEALNNAEKIIIEIIETQAWKPLGYKSFEDAWNDRLNGTRLATRALKAHVVYELMSGGADDTDVIATTGVGDQVVKRLRQQKEAGVPASRATTMVRSHTRGTPSKPMYLHLQFGSAELARLRAQAKAQGLDLEVESRKAVLAHFKAKKAKATTAKKSS